MKKDDLHQNGNKVQTLENPVSPQHELTEGKTEDELIDVVAARVLERFRPALEELAK